MNPVILAGVVKRVYPDFDMNHFYNRIKLQKLVYLIQSSDLNLGYNFRLYLHGPYSTTLTREGFEMPNFNDCPEMKFEDLESEKRFSELFDFLRDKKDDADTMEIIASLLLFHNLYPSKSEKEIIKLVEEKSPKFNGENQKINNLLLELKSCRVLTW